MESNLFPIVISVISLFAAIATAVRTHLLREHQARLSHRNEFQRNLLDLNKELIRDPELWGFFDKPLGDSSKFHALGYSYLNLFELVFVFFHSSEEFFQTCEDRADWAVWDRTIRHIV